MKAKHRKKLRAYLAIIVETTTEREGFSAFLEEMLGHPPTDIEMHAFRQCVAAMAERLRAG